jgi:hypothetical protein
VSKNNFSEFDVKAMSQKATPKLRVFQFTFPLDQRGRQKTAAMTAMANDKRFCDKDT